MKKIVVLGSGGGSNFQAIVNNIKNKKIKGAIISLVISSKEEAGILEKAKKEGIKTFYIKSGKKEEKQITNEGDTINERNGKTEKSTEEEKKLNIEKQSEQLEKKDSINNEELLEVLKRENPDLIVLAGYLKIIPKEIIKNFKKKIINIHPSLIPKYCGKGMYGIKPHEEVIKNNEKETGATVHFVDEGVDTGEIIIQRSIEVLKDDTKESLQKRVLEQVEHKIFSEAIIKVLG